MDNGKLCIKLLKSESEHEVISYLESAGYWNDPSAWKYNK